jgi:hypothetical protein
LLKAFDDRDAEPAGDRFPGADSLRALRRQQDGSWLIVSEMFQDANTETTYAH